MEKDWTGSAMPSVLKGFAMIGQPVKAEEFKKAFGYNMPEITFSEEEKRRVAENNGLEPAIRQEEKQPAAKTEQTALNFGREVLARIKAGNTLQAGQQEKQEQKEQQQQPPLQIDIRGVGNSQPEEDPTGNAQTNRNGGGPVRIDDPYAAKTLEILKKQSKLTNNTVPLPNRTGNIPAGTPAKTLEMKNPASYTQKAETELLANNRQNPNAQTGNLFLNYLLQTGRNENADNIAAQPDPEGKHPNALEPVREGVNQATKEFVEKSAGLIRQQQETEGENHALNWIADVARDAMPNPLTHPRQDYQSGYQAILGHEANQKLAEAAAEPIQTDVNGKEKYRIVVDAFINKYVTEPGKLALAIVSLADHALATGNGDKPINPSITRNVDENLFDLIDKSATWLKNSITIEKLNKAIVAGDDAKTVENLTQFGYELLGENGPWAAVSLSGGSLLAGASMTGAGMTAFKLTKDFSVNLAEANASIVKETGTHDWELAFNIASLKVVGGRAIDGQMKSLIKTGGKGGVFLEQLGDALKKRFNSMVDGFYFNKDKRKDEENPK